MKLLNVHECASSQDGELKVCGAKRSIELLGREYRAKVLRVDAGKALIPFLGVDVSASSERVRFRAEFTGAEANDEVELGEVF